jgi:hypothetical protein
VCKAAAKPSDDRTRLVRGGSVFLINIEIESNANAIEQYSPFGE